MQRKICNIIYFFLVAFLIFDNIPNLLRMNFIGGILANKLSFYPFIVGFVYTLYCQYKYKNVLVNLDKFFRFVMLYLMITLMSLIVGLYNYPYYDLIVNGPITQIEKLPKVLEVLNGFGVYVDEKLLTAFWMIARVVKGVLFDVIYAFGGAYMIYCWYHNDWQTALKVLVKGVLVSLVVVFGYSVIEVFYLAGNETAKNVLEVITPYFHIIKADGTWHPPLLWKNALRSLFSEASHYGIYFAFAMPILWYVFFEIQKSVLKLLVLISITVFTFGLFLTQARTAVVLFCGEVFILFVFTIYLKNKLIFREAGKIFVASITAFMLSVLFINNLLPNNRYGIDGIESYLESNLYSLGSTSQRSNAARYSIMIADLKVGLDYPLTGVGLGLRNAYIPDYLPEMAKDNGEVQMWIKNQKEKGVLRSGFPKLGEYTSRFAETGIIGLTLFLVPQFILLRKLYLKITDKSIIIDDKLPYIFFTI